MTEDRGPRTVVAVIDQGSTFLHGHCVLWISNFHSLSLRFVIHDIIHDMVLTCQVPAKCSPSADSASGARNVWTASCQLVKERLPCEPAHGDLFA